MKVELQLSYVMKKFVLSVIIFMLLMVLSQAQTINDTQSKVIDFEEQWISLKYYTYDGQIDLATVADLMKNNVKAKNLLESAIWKYEFGTFSVAMGSVSLISAVTISFNKKMNWVMISSGLGAITLAGFMFKSSKKNAKQAVGVYNDWIENSARTNVSVNLKLTAVGPGLSLSF